MAKQKQPREAKLQYMPEGSRLISYKSLVPKPEPKPSLIARIVKAPFRLLSKIVQVPVDAIQKRSGD